MLLNKVYSEGYKNNDTFSMKYSLPTKKVVQEKFSLNGICKIVF